MAGRGQIMQLTSAVTVTPDVARVSELARGRVELPPVNGAHPRGRRSGGILARRPRAPRPAPVHHKRAGYLVLVERTGNV
jgi:hypothetical protein